MTGVRSHKSLGDLFLGSFCLLLPKVMIEFWHKMPIKGGRYMAGYYSKRQKKYIGFHSYFYCGIGFILGTLIHSLFTWRFGVTHFIFFFIAMLEIVYALIQMHRYRSYAPLKVRKTAGKKKIRGSDLFTIVLCTVIAILVIYKFGFY